LENLKEKEQLEELVLDYKLIIKSIESVVLLVEDRLQSWASVNTIIYFRISGECGEFFGQLSGHQRLKKSSVPLTSFMIINVSVL
jgi:abortive infection bacteriophage resistance protein